MYVSWLLYFVSSTSVCSHRLYVLTKFSCTYTVASCSSVARSLPARGPKKGNSGRQCRCVHERETFVVVVINVRLRRSRWAFHQLGIRSNLVIEFNVTQRAPSLRSESVAVPLATNTRSAQRTFLAHLVWSRSWPQRRSACRRCHFAWRDDVVCYGGWWRQLISALQLIRAFVPSFSTARSSPGCRPMPRHSWDKRIMDPGDASA